MKMWKVGHGGGQRVDIGPKRHGRWSWDSNIGLVSPSLGFSFVIVTASTLTYAGYAWVQVPWVKDKEVPGGWLGLERGSRR
jgi:hypothetical protein